MRDLPGSAHPHLDDQYLSVRTRGKHGQWQAYLVVSVATCRHGSKRRAEHGREQVFSRRLPARSSYADHPAVQSRAMPDCDVSECVLRFVNKNDRHTSGTSICLNVTEFSKRSRDDQHVCASVYRRPQVIVSIRLLAR
jgi:hypothetical protein